VPRLFALCTLALLLAGCGKALDTSGGAAPTPVEIQAGTTCDLDGMLLNDYPGPKAQVFYAGQDRPDFFCDTIELLNALLKPEQVRALRVAYVQDMGQANWDHPEGHWFDATTGWYVLGSQRQGSMGPTIASFAKEADATRFAAEQGGKVLRFAQITADMVDLSGGAGHDNRM
jgi:copper chaperone NosL